MKKGTLYVIKNFEFHFSGARYLQTSGNWLGTLRHVRKFQTEREGRRFLDGLYGIRPCGDFRIDPLVR